MSRCPACSGPLSAAHRFCANCGTPVHRSAPRDERRLVSVVFASVPDLMQVADSLPPGEAAALAREAMSRLARCVEDEGGRVDKIMGESLMGVFGAPVAHENDPVRAARCAASMSGALRGVPSLESLAVCAGVSTGRVLAGHVGDGEAASFTVMGDAVNVAQRLQSHARPGEVLVSGATARHLAGVMELEPLPPLRVRNRAEPVQAFRILAHKDRATLRPASPFYGREAELALLAESAASAWGGNGTVVWVVGPSGCGKSRLIDAFRDRQGIEGPAPVVYTGVCAPGGADLFYWPIRDVLRQMLAVAPGESPERIRSALDLAVDAGLDREAAAWAGSLLGLPMPDALAGLDARSRSLALRLALRRGLAVAARRHPVLLILEDFQWADAATSEWVESLSGHLDRTPVLVLVASQEAGAPSDAAAARRVELGPWLPQDIVGYLRQWGVPEGNARHEAERLHGRTAGLPAFLESVLRDWQAGGLWSEGQALPADAPLPESLEAAYVARLDRLPESPREAATVAALLESPMPAAHLEAALGRECATDVEHLIRADVLMTLSHGEAGRTVSRRILFRAEGFREAAAGLHTRARRKSIMTRYAAFIETDPEVPPALRARAWTGAGEAPRAVPHWVRAGLDAAAALQFPAALDAFNRAFETAAEHGGLSATETESAAVAKARALEFLAQWEAGLTFTRMAARVLEGESPALLIREASFLRLLGRYAEARATAETALQRARDQHDRKLEGDALIQLGGIAYRSGAMGEAQDCYERALLLRQGTADRDGEASAYMGLGLIAFESGDFGRATSHYERGLDLYQQISNRYGEADTLMNLGILHARAGNLALARSMYYESLTIRRDMGDVAGEANVLGNLGELDYLEGDLTMAEERLGLAQDVCDANGDPDPEFLIYLGEVRRRLGRHPDAEQDLRRAEEQARKLGNGAHLARSLFYRSLVAADLGRASESLSLRREAGEAARRTADPDLLAMMEDGKERAR